MSLGILEQRASENEQKYVQTIDDEVQHMSTLVNELLSFSKASLGAPASIETLAVANAVRRALDREQVEGVQFDVKVPPNLAVEAQSEYLFRALSNVIRNAIRYAGGEGPIEIAAAAVDKAVIITVADHGPGVRPEELENILKPFYRPENARQRETGGVGLGLAIVRSCVEACGGAVTCRNRSPRGFEVELRLRAA
jgi:two-component system sensor histidine kinase CpxA